MKIQIRIRKKNSGSAALGKSEFMEFFFYISALNRRNLHI